MWDGVFIGVNCFMAHIGPHLCRSSASTLLHSTTAIPSTYLQVVRDINEQQTREIKEAEAAIRTLRDQVKALRGDVERLEESVAMAGKEAEVGPGFGLMWRSHSVKGTLLHAQLALPRQMAG